MNSTGFVLPLLSGLLWLSLAAPASASDFALVAHSENPTTAFSKQDLRDYYLGRKKFWPHGEPIRVVLPARSSGARALLFGLLEMKPRAFGKHWTALLYRNEASRRPKSADDKRALRIVRGDPGALAIVDASAIPPGFKVLSLAGKRAGESGYLLREPESPPKPAVFAKALTTTLAYLRDTSRFSQGVRVLVVHEEQTRKAGADLKEALAKLVGQTKRRTVMPKSVALVTLKDLEGRLGEFDCVVLAPGSPPEVAERVAKLARSAKVLSVATESAAARGGIALALVRHGKRLEPYVNRGAAEGAGHPFKTLLYSYARVVGETSR